MLAMTLAVSGVGTATATAIATPSPRPLPVAELAIAGADEPGQPLRITGRVLDAISGAPVTDASVIVYHADDGGEYEPADPGDDTTARLRGELRSDDEGRFAFRTILPGEYPDQPPGNRHIHVHSVSAEGYAPLGFVILFDDNVRDDVRAWAGDTGFGRIIETTDDAGVLQGSLDILLDPIPPQAISEE